MTEAGNRGAKKKKFFEEIAQQNVDEGEQQATLYESLSEYQYQ